MTIRGYATALLLGLLTPWPSRACETAAWTRILDGPPLGAGDKATSVAVDTAGFVYVTGQSNDNYCTVKHAPDGTVVWRRLYNSSVGSSDFAYAIALDESGNVYVTGRAQVTSPDHDYATVKYLPNGDVGWIRTYDGTARGEDWAHAIVVDAFGNSYVAGTSEGVGSGDDIVTIKYTAAGDTAWVRRVNDSGNGDDLAYALALAPDDGGVIVSGWGFASVGSWDYLTIRYDANGDTLWTARYNGPGNSSDNPFQVAFDGNGNAYVAGRSLGAGSGYDYATIKYAPDGAQVWAKRYNGPANGRDDGYGLAVDESGHAVVTGFSTAPGSVEDILTIRYDTNGNELWTRRYNGPAGADDYGYAVVIDDVGGVRVAGISVGIGTSYDITTLGYSPSGGDLCENRIGGTGNGYDTPGAEEFPSKSLAVDAQRNVYMTGFVINSSIDLITVKFEPVVTSVPVGGATVVSIDGVYPNPLGGAGTIALSLGRSEPVALRLFDAQGRERRRIVEPDRRTAGKHWLPLDATGLESGVYFLRVSTPSSSETRKLVVVR